MKILFSTAGFSGSGVDYPSTLATELKDRGHNVTGLCFANYPQIGTIDIKTKWTLRSVDRYIYTNITDRYPWITGYGRWAFNWILYRRWKRIVRKELEKNNYDIVVTTRIAIAPSTIAANEKGVPSVIITTGPATVKYDPSNTDKNKTPRFSKLSIAKKVQYPFIRSVHNWNESAFTTASELVAINEFDASITRETFDLDPKVLYIPVPVDEFKADTGSGSNITLINPRDSNKGLSIFLKIAESFPEESFLIAGSLYDDSFKSVINQTDNVSYYGWCDDMREVYSSTKLLLIPSTYQEGGPRIIPEAFVNGIPAIGSDIGGIPDYIDDGGDIVEKYKDIDEWVAVIEQYLSDEDYYKMKARNARRRSELFDQNKIVTEFEEILKTHIGES